MWQIIQIKDLIRHALPIFVFMDDVSVNIHKYWRTELLFTTVSNENHRETYVYGEVLCSSKIPDLHSNSIGFELLQALLG
jgi:hypothetical protein